MGTHDQARIRRAQAEVILAAVAFALGVPAGKILLADLSPLGLSGVFYLSAGLACLLLIVRSGRTSDTRVERNLIRGVEWAWLTGAIAAGGVLGPLALLYGLRAVSGHVAGLLLNFEAVFTIGIATLIAGERVGRRGWLGAGAILAGALLLSIPGKTALPAEPIRWTGVLLVVAACAFWGIDNNLTQRVSIRDARQIVAIKGIVAGAFSLLLAAILGQFSNWNLLRVLAAAGVGMVSFGLSIALFVRGLRELGVIQTGMLFALAPGFAAVLSWILLREQVTISSLAALGLMTTGAVVLATDQHRHLHFHQPVKHTHEHTHDEHHIHEHTPEELAAMPHVHPHRHEPLEHAHPHVHDIHHRHGH